jgi:hypothetical protein
MAIRKGSRKGGDSPVNQHPTAQGEAAEVTVETEDAPAGAPDTAGRGPDPGPEAPAGPPPLQLPILFRGQWRRDWRLSRELVGKGMLTLDHEQVILEGRRSSFLRGVAYLVFRLALLLALLISVPVVLITSLGVANATSSAAWLLGGPICSFLGVAVVAILLGYTGRALLQPRVKLAVPWESLRYVASDGRFVKLSVQSGRKRMVGRLRPNWRTRRRDLLEGIRQGRLPGGTGRSSKLRYRPVWVDRLVQVAVIAALVLGLDQASPYLAEAWQTRGEPSSGPLAGIPSRLTAAQLEMANLAACSPGDSDAPRVHNRRVGDHLAWTFDLDADHDARGHRVGHLLWEAGTARTELLGFIGARSPKGDERGFFREADDLVGLSVVVPEASAATALPMLRGQGIEGLRVAWCAGHVVSFDLTQTQRDGDDGTLHATREGPDLVVRVDGAAPSGWLLPVRRRVSSEVDLFDICEIPVQDGALGLLPARPERRYQGFFSDAGEQARVYLISQEHLAEAQRLANMGENARCAVADSLYLSGVAQQRAVTDLAGMGPMALRARAWTKETRWLPLKATPDQAVEAISGRYRALVEALDLARRPLEDQAAANQGFLDAMEWSMVLDTLSFQHALPQVERLRQRLSGADPNGAQGELFLFALAEAFLERVEPTEEQYNARFDVGHTWLEVTAGTTWTADGRTIRIPDELTAGYYQVVGRFVLMDLARRIEHDVDTGRFARPSVFLLESRLAAHDIILDFHKSSSRKALEAWAGGDFGYLADRAVSKLQQAARDEEAAIAAARAANYHLRESWQASGGGARYADLLQDGKKLGWVAIFEQPRVAVDYQPVQGHALSREALGQGHRLLLATSGSYVTPEDRTSGLSFADGHVQNFLVSPKMHGLVVMDQNGALSMLDMKRGGTLPGLGRTIRPLESLADFHTLLAWLRKNKASAFQTHLLANAGELTIERDKADPAMRERRLLVQASKDDEPRIVVVDIPGTHKKSLAEAAEVAMNALLTPEADGGPGLGVQAIANLDVGSYDILGAWSDGGTLLREGPVPMSSARNLVTVALR